MYLFGQQIVQPFDIDTDMISHRVVVDRGFPVKSRENDGPAQFDNFVQAFPEGSGLPSVCW